MNTSFESADSISEQIEELLEYEEQMYSDKDLLPWFKDCSYTVIEAHWTDSKYLRVTLKECVNDIKSCVAELTNAIESYHFKVDTWWTESDNTIIFNTSLTFLDDDYKYDIWDKKYDARFDIFNDEPMLVDDFLQYMEDSKNFDPDDMTDVNIIHWFDNGKYTVIDAGWVSDAHVEIIVILDDVLPHNKLAEASAYLSEIIETNGLKVVDSHTNTNDVFIFNVIE